MAKQPQVTIGKASSQRPDTGRSPSVTIGKATSQTGKAPNVTIGQATGVGAPVRIPAPQNNALTLGQLITQNAAPAPSFVITELTGPQRTITLRERAMPFRGSLKFGSQQRIDEAEYTGFPRINQTVLGARENDTEMNGEWHDRFIGDTAGLAMADLTRAVDSPSIEGAIEVLSDSILSAKDLCAIFEDVVYCARPVRLTWAHIRRIGRLTMFEQDWQNLHDVKWKMTFKWISRDEQLALPSPSRASLIGVNDALSAAYTDLHDVTNFDNIEDLDTGFADSVDVAVGKIKSSILDLSDAIDTRVGAVTDSADALQRAITIATLVQSQTQELIETVDGVVSPAIVALTEPTPITPGARKDPVLLPDTDPGAALNAAVQKRATIRVARLLKHVAARQRFSAARSLETEVLGVVLLRDQQDLRDLSLQWYGTPDPWNQIRKFNGFENSTQPAGTVVLIPALRAK